MGKAATANHAEMQQRLRVAINSGYCLQRLLRYTRVVGVAMQLLQPFPGIVRHLVVRTRCCYA
jgi:hypothetical protein